MTFVRHMVIVHRLKISLETTFSVEELVEKLPPWARVDHVGGHLIKIEGRREHILGVSHDVNDLK